MVSILLIILKIIGITLLVIIGFILVVMLLVLFVPVRYKAEGGYKEVFCCKAKVTWLLHFISVKIDVGEAVTTSVRICAIPLSFSRKKEKGDGDLSLSSKKGNRAVEKEATDSEKNIQSYQDDMVMSNAESKTVESFLDEDGQTGLDETLEKEDGKQTFFEKCGNRFRSIWDKVKRIYDKVKKFFVNIKEFFAGVEEKKQTLKRYLKIVKSDVAKEAFVICKSKIFRMLKHIFPKKMLVNIHFGLEDPANTGYILGVYGVLPNFIGDRFLLYPNFESKLFQCDFHLKGSIRIWTLLYQILGIVFDENCKKLYHIVKKEISNESK